MHLDDGRVVPNFLQQALRKEPLTIYGDGSQTRSFCYVDDLVDGIVRLLYSDEHHPVNIGNPSETTILDFAEVIKHLTGNDVDVVFKPGLRGEGDPQRRQPDITLARQALSWEPKIDIKEGLKRTIPYFQRGIGLV